MRSRRERILRCLARRLEELEEEGYVTTDEAYSRAAAPFAARGVGRELNGGGA